MNRGSIYFCAVLSLLFVACSGKKQVHSLEELPSYDSLSVSIDYPILSNYVILQPYVRGNEYCLVGGNSFIHSLDFVDLSGGEHVSIELEQEGPNGVLKNFNFCQSGDKLVCRDEGGIVVLDTMGKVHQRLPMKDLLSPDGKYRIRAKGLTFGNFQTTFSSVGDEVFIPMFPAQKDGDVKIGKVYNVSNNAVEELPISYPEEMKNHMDLLAGLAMSQITAYEDRILCSFPASSSCFLYDRKSGETKRFELNSCSVPNTIDAEKIEGMDLKRKFTNEVISHRFGAVYYCADTRSYYRVHYGPKESMKDKNRSIYLMVCDEDAENVREYILPSHFSEQYVVMGSQILFLCKGSNDMELRFAKIDVRKI